MFLTKESFWSGRSLVEKQWYKSNYPFLNDFDFLPILIYLGGIIKTI